MISVNVSHRMGDLLSMFDWAKENCPGQEWQTRWCSGGDKMDYHFEFIGNDVEELAIMFKLKFGV